MTIDTNINYGKKLIRFGILLFMLGLITGFIIPLLENPRMGLSSHLEGTLNGMLLIIIGLIWSRLDLNEKLYQWCYRLALFGTFSNWLTTLLAAVWGAGKEMMPISGGNFQGTVWQEVLIKFGLISLSISMLVVCVILLFGLKKNTSKV